MPEHFVSLRESVRRPARPEASAVAPAREIVTAAAQAHPAVPLASFASDIALLRAAARDAFQREARALLSRLGCDVLARELAIAPCDLAALADDAIAAYERFEPVAILVSEAVAPQLTCALPVRGDASLEAGDVSIVVRDGAFESRFDYRIERSIATAVARLGDA